MTKRCKLVPKYIQLCTAKLILKQDLY